MHVFQTENIARITTEVDHIILSILSACVACKDKRLGTPGKQWLHDKQRQRSITVHHESKATHSSLCSTPAPLQRLKFCVTAKLLILYPWLQINPRKVSNRPCKRTTRDERCHRPHLFIQAAKSKLHGKTLVYKVQETSRWLSQSKTRFIANRVRSRVEQSLTKQPWSANCDGSFPTCYSCFSFRERNASTRYEKLQSDLFRGLAKLSSERQTNKKNTETCIQLPINNSPPRAKITAQNARGDMTSKRKSSCKGFVMQSAFCSTERLCYDAAEKGIILPRSWRQKKEKENSLGSVPAWWNGRLSIKK